MVHDELLEINVGGTNTYIVSTKVLRKLPNSDLAKHFEDPSKMQKLKDGKIFIDRNGKIFGMIIDYLRNDCTLPIIDKK